MELTEAEIAKLNSKRALKYMLQGNNRISINKTLRYVKYEDELEKKQVELIKLQHWVINNNKRVCVVFEGRDSAGKGLSKTFPPSIAP